MKRGLEAPNHPAICRVLPRMTLALANGFLAALMLSSVSALSEAQTERPFEVATVKPTTRPDRESSGFIPTPGQFVAQKVPATTLIAYAYRGITDEVRGQPEWANNEFYSVIAKPPDGVKPDQYPAMLRTLLLDRFNLAAHVMRKSREVMALVRAEPGKEWPRGLERVNVDCNARVGLPPEPLPRGADDAMPLCRLRDDGMMMNSGGLPLTFLANRLGSVIGKRVVIDPELDGAFRFLLRYTVGLPGSPEPTDAAPHIITAVRDQLGLKLVERRAEVNVLMVDRFERPTPD
jgi:uncharacterized protein (TIGR03435 family)